jgi:hypothetical protein
MDERIKRNTKQGRESRAQMDVSRQEPEKQFVSSEERRRAFRSEWLQEALPTPPEIPGFHLCWLSSTNQYDPIHKRLRLGYSAVKADEIAGFDHLRVKSGEHEGFIACNEMLLFKIPMDVYQDLMAEMHHYAPLDEQEKIKVQQDQLLNSRDSQGKPLVQIEGEGMRFDQTAEAPLFR